MGTHTISNTATFHGWLESTGLDDLLANPCGCLFGDDEPPPQPMLPGQRARMSQRSASQKNSGSGGARARRGQVSRQATVAQEEEPKSPFGALAFFTSGGR